MQISKATAQSRNEVVDLLQAHHLPTGDLPEILDDFYLAIDEQKIIGVIGMERYAPYGLLRSMVVHPDYRNRQVAEKLVQFLEQSAASAGIKTMYLLTETAEKYFGRKHYRQITRADVPLALLTSSEFSHVCPSSATVMKKDLANTSGD